jgi:hypothetical protein
MVSSEALAPPTALSSSSNRHLPSMPPSGWVREIPQFTPPVFPFVPPSVPRQTRRLLLTVASPPSLAFAPFARARLLFFPRPPVLTWSRNPAQGGTKFALCCGPKGCSPCTGKGFYIRAFTSPSHLNEASNMTTRANSQFPRPVFHRLDMRHYGLQTNVTNLNELHEFF